jgi:multidrug resistance protein MdtO
MSAANMASVGGWWQLIQHEAAPAPGRLDAALRMAASAAIVTLIWMWFQIPLAAYAVYIVFMVQHAEARLTLRTAIGGMVAATAAVAGTLLLLLVDIGEPALRLPLMALCTYAGMALSRQAGVGPLAFLAGFVLVLTQTLVDVIPSPEALTRLILWLWVVTAVPALVCVTLQGLITQDPRALPFQRALELLDAWRRQLLRSAAPTQWDAAVSLLADQRQRAAVQRAGFLRSTAQDLTRLAQLDRAIRITSLLPSGTADAVRRSGAERIQALRDAFAARQAATPGRGLGAQWLATLDTHTRCIAVALQLALSRLEAEPQRDDLLDEQRARVQHSIPPDATQIRDQRRFALKATLAAMSCYLLYNFLDWPGIRTCVVTCFFVALTTTGETIHKLSLRLAGALIGGGLALLAIVFLLPLLTDVGQLMVLVAAVALVAGWITAGSERFSYFGAQLAFAFFVGLFQDYAPTTELVAVRDRVIGILIGNLAMSLVFTTLWPVSARDTARRARQQVCRLLAQQLAPGARPDWLQIPRALAAAHRLAERGRFEGADHTANASQKAQQALESVAAGVALVQQLSGDASASARSDNRRLRRLLLRPERAHLHRPPHTQPSRGAHGTRADEALLSAQGLLLEQLQQYRRCEASTQ